MVTRTRLDVTFIRILSLCCIYFRTGSGAKLFARIKRDAEDSPPPSVDVNCVYRYRLTNTALTLVASIEVNSRLQICTNNN
jgi:hypothetical protein